MSSPVGEITLLLSDLQQGNAEAGSKLMALVYAQLRQIAAHHFRSERPDHTLQPTALVHEAWLRLTTDEEVRWQNRGHFFAAAAEAMRRILIERARRRSRLKHGSGQVRLDIQGLELADTTPDDKVLLINEALERFQAEDPEKARVVVMKFFGGLTNREVAESLNVAERTVERQWAYAKAWLFSAIRKEF